MWFKGEPCPKCRRKLEINLTGTDMMIWQGCPHCAWTSKEYQDKLGKAFETGAKKKKLRFK